MAKELQSMGPWDLFNVVATESTHGATVPDAGDYVRMEQGWSPY